jgi:hypothetical protein
MSLSKPIYSLNLTFQGCAPTPVYPWKPDLLRTVPSTLVIWLREANSLYCPEGPETEGALKGQWRHKKLGLRKKNYMTFFHLSEEDVGSDSRTGTLAGLRQ